MNWDMILNHISTNYIEIVAMALFGIGFSMLLFSRNLLRKVVGLDIMDTGVYLFLASMGYIEDKLTPIVPSTGDVNALHYINPIPAGLVLTGIVVGVSVTAVSLSLIQKLYKEYHTLDMDEIMTMVRKESEQ